MKKTIVITLLAILFVSFLGATIIYNHNNIDIYEIESKDETLFNNKDIHKVDMQLVEKTCSFCKGTGYNLFPESGPRYTTERPLMKRGEKCDAYPYCSERVYSHYHKRCPSCNGKGKTKHWEYVY